MQNFLGIDHGAKKIGLATGNDEIFLATPLKVLRRKGNEELMRDLKITIEEHQINGIVLGMPLGLDGGDTEETEKVRVFLSLLEKELTISVETVDERLTTKATSKLDVKGDDDAVSAMLILQTYLDRERAKQQRGKATIG